jgi:hypothetical protein
VAAGIGHDGIGRVLEGATGRYSPNGWARKTLEVAWKAATSCAVTFWNGSPHDAVSPPFQDDSVT